MKKNFTWMKVTASAIACSDDKYFKFSVERSLNFRIIDFGEIGDYEVA